MLICPRPLETKGLLSYPISGETKWKTETSLPLDGARTLHAGQGGLLETRIVRWHSQSGEVPVVVS